MLSARSAAFTGFHFNIGRIDFDFHIFDLRKHRHCDCRGMDASLRLRFRDALHAVHTAFKLQSGIRTCPSDQKGNFLKTAEPRLINADQLCTPPHLFGIHLIHTV